ncbi:MAG: antibiotic biosynthesis monooxygenase [Bacteroidia bacterium]|nr:antibiotic biosynthesis monooxygenase [Bacteroidia bacterium]NNF32404.1 antibiotic biosynthesis monooxygenase [Flavobacteriaceae bacterium]NNJ82408.1 antibiotic biosynthesis monooxygenase [Flavobacteriaceae bacterium]NNK55444.1 antibiotic biosynthesis monooxygenase [Flavobacteriaceae bacterium]
MKEFKMMSPKWILLMVTVIIISCNSVEKESELNVSEATVVLVKYKAQPEKGSEAVSELTRLIEKVELEPNFLNLKLHVDPADETNILLYEVWSDVDYYNSAHMNTAHLKEFIENSRNFLAGPPEISFWNVENEFKPSK